MSRLEEKPETIFSELPPIIPKPLKIEVEPLRVTLYQGSTKKEYKNLKLLKDTIRLCNPDNSNQLDIHKQFLLQYANSSKLISMELDNELLNILTLEINGKFKRSEYPIDLSKYRYQYISNNLTKEKLFPFQRFKNHCYFDITYSYRPLPNFHDFDINFHFNTKNFNYRLGINTYYYPTLDNPVGVGPILSITYKFKQLNGKIRH